MQYDLPIIQMTCPRSDCSVPSSHKLRLRSISLLEEVENANFIGPNIFHLTSEIMVVPELPWIRLDNQQQSLQHQSRNNDIY
jgi:hypothetical protein